MTSREGPHSATHAALAVEELQELIFLQLLVFEGGGWPNKTQKDLTNLAVICRAFLEVALNVRWRSISFGQLLQVWEAQGVLVQVDMPLDESTEMEFARAPTYEDWQRFEYYARRIVCMRLDFLPATTQFSSTFAIAVSNGSRQPIFQVKAQSPVLPIFPRLKSLEWKFGEGTSEVRVITAVISESPALDSVVVWGSQEREQVPSDSWIALFSSLSNKGRPLKSLAIRAKMHGIGASYDINAKTSSLVRLIRRSTLQQLILPSDAIRTEIIASVIRCIPTLKVLQVCDLFSFSDDPNLEALPAVFPHDAFSSLECLKGDTITVGLLLVIPTFPSLAKLMIHSPAYGANVAWPFVREMIGAIGQSCPALEVLHLSAALFCGENGDYERTRRTTTSVYRSLQACPRLKDVIFDFYETRFDAVGSIEEGINLSDAQWEQLAEAWPDLTSVWFGVRPGYKGHGWAASAPPPRATLRTVASFFRHCSKLVSFGVAIFARGEEARTALEEVSPKQGPTRLDFRGSWINKEDVQDVGIFLTSQAPHQDTEIQIHQFFEGYEPASEGRLLPQRRAMEIARCEDWQEVKQLVESARTTRQAWIV